MPLVVDNRSRQHFAQGVVFKSPSGKEAVMLILTRRIGESIRIGDSVEVTVMAMNGNQVRIGISAPREIPVHREEVVERILSQSNAASLT
jgi:carbon storage regulator